MRIPASKVHRPHAASFLRRCSPMAVPLAVLTTPNPEKRPGFCYFQDRALNRPFDVMPHTFSNLIVAPIIGWLTLIALAVVSYLLRLEIAERRRNRRLDAKRAELGLLDRDERIIFDRIPGLSSRLKRGQVSRMPTGSASALSSSESRLQSRKHRAQSPQSRNRRPGCLRSTQRFEKQTFKFQRPPPFEID